MNTEEQGVLSTVEIARAIEYLRIVGLTGEQLYGFWVYVATGHMISGVANKG